MNKIFFSFIFLISCVGTSFGMDIQFNKAQQALAQLEKQWPLSPESKKLFATIKAFFTSYNQGYDADSSSSEEESIDKYYHYNTDEEFNSPHCPPPSKSSSSESSDDDANGTETLNMLDGRYF